MTRLREATRALVGLNDCDYFTVESGSVKVDVSNLWCDMSPDVVCPQRLSTGRATRGKGIKVAGPLPCLLQEFRSSLPEQMFSKPENLPVTTGEILRILQKRCSLSLLLGRGRCRLFLQCPAVAMWSAGSVGTGGTWWGPAKGHQWDLEPQELLQAAFMHTVSPVKPLSTALKSRSSFPSV